MDQLFLELTEDEFDKRFTFVINHLNSSAGWVCGGNRGCLYETYGEELAFVKRQDMRRVWTVVDGDDGDIYIVSGFHHINRVGYLVSHNPILDNVSIQARLSMGSDEKLEDRGEQT